MSKKKFEKACSDQDHVRALRLKFKVLATFYDLFDWVFALDKERIDARSWKEVDHEKRHSHKSRKGHESLT